MADETISLDDIQIFSRVVHLRLGHRIAELRRIGRVQDVLRAAGNLAEALTSYSARASSDCTGQGGTAELDAEATRLFASFAICAESLRSAATEYRTRVLDGTARLESANEHGAAQSEAPVAITQPQSLGI